MRKQILSVDRAKIIKEDYLRAETITLTKPDAQQLSKEIDMAPDEATIDAIMSKAKSLFDKFDDDYKKKIGELNTIIAKIMMPKLSKTASIERARLLKIANSNAKYAKFVEQLNNILIPDNIESREFAEIMDKLSKIDKEMASIGEPPKDKPPQGEQGSFGTAQIVAIVAAIIVIILIIAGGGYYFISKKTSEPQSPKI